MRKWYGIYLERRIIHLIGHSSLVDIVVLVAISQCKFEHKYINLISILETQDSVPISRPDVDHVKTRFNAIQRRKANTPLL